MRLIDAEVAIERARKSDDIGCKIYVEGKIFKEAKK